MPQVLKPSWGLFERLVATAKEDLIICTPWISSAGVQRLRGLLRNDPHGGPLQKVQLWARIADINTDSPGILELVRTLGAARISTVVRDSPVLHAKIYLADRALALVTSANLSEGGFSENLEAAVVISEPEGVQQVVQLLAGIEAETALVSITDLEYFVAEERPLLEEQAVPEAPPATIPVWRRRVQSSRALSEEPLAGPGKESGQSKPVDLMEVIQWVKASLQAAQNEIQHVDLRDWIGKKARVWVCPCYVPHDISPYLSQIAALYSLGELEFGQRLPPERFTSIEGTVETMLERGRALFRKKRSRQARIELTRFPDRGSADPLNNTDSRFLLKIQAVE